MIKLVLKKSKGYNMKVQISFELDLADTTDNVNKISDLPLVIQNISDLIYHGPKNYLHEEIMDCLTGEKTETKNLMYVYYKKLQDLTDQIFNNFKIKGVTEDGHIFCFTHQEPGYVEETLIDGEPVYLNDLILP